MSRQFHLRTLLVVVAFCAFGTWWVIRPRQTAQWFVTEGYRETFANEETGTRASLRQLIERDPSKIVVTSETRSWSDIVVGNQSFFVTCDQGRYRLDVVRGQVTAVSFYLPTPYYLLDVF